MKPPRSGRAAQQAGVGHGHVDLRPEVGDRRRGTTRSRPSAPARVRVPAVSDAARADAHELRAVAPAASRYAWVTKSASERRRTGPRRRGGSRRRPPPPRGSRRPAPWPAQAMRSSKAGGPPKQASASRAAGPDRDAELVRRQERLDHPRDGAAGGQLVHPVGDAAGVGRAGRGSRGTAGARGWPGRRTAPNDPTPAVEGWNHRRGGPGTGRGPRTRPRARWSFLRPSSRPGSRRRRSGSRPAPSGRLGRRGRRGAAGSP